MESNNTLPGDINISNFDYELPKEKIAFYPLENRDQSKLLVVKEDEIIDSTYTNIAHFLKPESLIIFNQSKVIYSRLHFSASNGSIIEIFCLEPLDQSTEINSAMQVTGSSQWRCLVGELKKWKEKELTLTVSGPEGHVLLKAELLNREAGTCTINFSWSPADFTFAEILENAGKVPLPPYIKRISTDSDKERYQTIYARREGSVAAPTAGLHFSEKIFAALREKGICIDYVTLHVGAGTFKPVKSEFLSEHEMHSEQIVIEKTLLQNLSKKIDQDIIAVGTTSLRTLESIYWIGLKLHLNLFKDMDPISVEQWEPYQLDAVISPGQAVDRVIAFLDEKKAEVLVAKTSILILPQYEFKLVQILATNFHQPKSTLMLLVAAFIGEKWKEVYTHALENNYRFLSYGDGSLLFRKK